MRSVLALFVAVLTILSSVALASPNRASLEARARKMQETRQYRNYVDLVARDNNKNKNNNKGGPGRGPGRDNGNHYGNDKGNGNGNGNRPGNGSRPGNGNGHGNGNGNGNDNGNGGHDFESDPDNCGAPFFVCPDSYNGLGQRICNYGQCKLKCPPGLEHKLNHLFPHITFCA